MLFQLLRESQRGGCLNSPKRDWACPVAAADTVPAANIDSKSQSSQRETSLSKVAQVGCQARSGVLLKRTRRSRA
jgi:hypothetical protein